MQIRIYLALQKAIYWATTLPPVAYLLVSILVTHPVAMVIPAFLATLVSPVFFILIGLSVLFDLFGMYLIETFQMPVWIGLLASWFIFFVWVL